MTELGTTSTTTSTLWPPHEWLPPRERSPALLLRQIAAMRRCALILTTTVTLLALAGARVASGADCTGKHRRGKLQPFNRHMVVLIF